MSSEKDSHVNDPARLARLRAFCILDSPAEPEFDDIVTVAAALCGTPIALVSLVEDKRQWFKARVGLDLPETPIEQAVCAYALDGAGLLEIPDLTADPRTAENALVTQPDGIRFYAGAPLLVEDGMVLGTLCVIDTVPRPEGLTVAQRGGLVALARQAMMLMEMRREKELRRLSDQRHDRNLTAEEAGRIGTFEIEVGTSVMRVSAEFCRLFGLPVAEAYAPEVAEALVHPEDRTVSSNARSRADGHVTGDVEYRIYRQSDGALRWIARRASFEFGDDGKPMKMLGTVHDVTERRQAGERVRALADLGDRLHNAESVPEAVEAAAATLGRTLTCSRAGYASMDLVGGQVSVLADWTAEGLDTVVGSRSVIEYEGTVARLREGRPVAFANIRQAEWLAAEATDYESVGAIAQIQIPLMVRGTLVGALFAQQNGVRDWTTEEVEFAQGVANRTYASIAKLEAQANQQLLNEELSHRMKNMLAMIIALAVQTLRDTQPRDAVDTFQKRLIALGSAHDTLMRRNWSEAPIRTIAEGVMTKLADEARATITGPDMTLGSRAALSLSLVLHELGTNAIKYGALSNDMGHIWLDWAIHGEKDAQMLVVTWREDGGPPVEKPDHEGFGSQLIALGLLGNGDAEIDYLPDGLIAEFRAPLRLAQSEQ